MIHEEICTYEVCKLAKEKGFNEYVEAFYAEDCNTPHSQGPEKWNEYKDRYAAPTQCLLQRWLREEKKMYVCPIIISDYEDDFHPDIVYWSFIILNTESGDSIYREYERIDDKRFATYELALEDALKYALENLV